MKITKIHELLQGTERVPKSKGWFNGSERKLQKEGTKKENNDVYKKKRFFPFGTKTDNFNKR